MIDKFGRVLVYVNDPKAVAEFFVNKLGFTQFNVKFNATGVFSVEVSPNSTSDALLEFFSKSLVKKIAPELSTDMPSICFSSYGLNDLRDKLASRDVNVGEIVEIAGSVTFNFTDIEGNYYSVREISRS